MHALDLDALRKPEIRFWTARCREELAGCAALKELDPCHAEIKSMRTTAAHRGKGVATKLLHHLIAEARTCQYSSLSLETGSMTAFQAARTFYEKSGFVYCAPFADYVRDPNSVFMTLKI